MLLKLHDKSSPLNYTHYAKLHPQNSVRIVVTDSVTSLHSMYTQRETHVARHYQSSCIYVIMLNYYASK